LEGQRTPAIQLGGLPARSGAEPGKFGFGSILVPQKSRQNGQLAFESGATSESGGTCPLHQRRTAPEAYLKAYTKKNSGDIAINSSRLINVETLKTRTARLKDEYENRRYAFHQKTKWKCRICRSAANIQGRRWGRYKDRAYNDDNGRQRETSVDQYETVRPVFQMWNGVWRQGGG